jgi:3'(2'), 5'-bisphosphate nucleotidase
VAPAKIIDQEEINYVSSLITKAGVLAPQIRADIEIIEKSGPNDRVTTADLTLSKLIVSELHKRFSADKIISEEDTAHDTIAKKGRVWLVDPIDGTDNYIANDGQYSVMIGLVIDLKPVFGWVYAPARSTIYFGGPGFGTWRQHGNETATRFEDQAYLQLQEHARIMVGWRDRKNNPWIKDLPQATLVKTGSIGLKVAKVLEREADLFVHLSGKLKTWDTAGPVAIALGGNLEVGAMDADELSFPEEGVIHQSSVIIGRPGSLQWCRIHLGNSVRDK